MNIESQVTSLELSKKLKELGVKQESLFYWIGDSIQYIRYKEEIDEFFNKNKSSLIVTYSAFNVLELLELLPSYRIYTKRYLNNDSWGCKDSYRYAPIFKDNNLPNACAKMLIYLIENKLNN